MTLIQQIFLLSTYDVPGVDDCTSSSTGTQRESGEASWKRRHVDWVLKIEQSFTGQLVPLWLEGHREGSGLELL